MDVNWNAYYGVGKGGAQIYQGNPALDVLNQKIQQQAAQKQRDEANFMTNLSKVNFKGASNPDLPELQKQYQDILSTHAQLRATNNPQQRALLNQQLQEKMQSTMFSANQSVENNQRNQKVYDLALMPNANLSDGYHDFAGKLMTTPTIGDHAQEYNQLYQNGVANVFDKPVDTNKIFDNAFDAVKSKKESSGAMVKDPSTGLYGRPVNTVTSADKEDFSNRVISSLKDNPAAAKRLMKDYGASDVQSAVQAAVNDKWSAYSKQLGTQTKITGSTESLGQKEQMHDDNRNYDALHPIGNTNQLTPAQSLVQGMQSGQSGTGEKLLNLAPQGQYGGNKPNINIDYKSGDHVFSFPPQIDQKAVEYNRQKRAEWKEANPNDPFDASEKGFALKQESLKPSKVYRINPASSDYMAKVAEMASEQNINLDRLNKIEGGKGGRGDIYQPIINKKHKEIKGTEQRLY